MIGECMKKYLTLENIEELKRRIAHRDQYYLLSGRGGIDFVNGFFSHSIITELVTTNVNRGRIIKNIKRKPDFLYYLSKEGDVELIIKRPGSRFETASMICDYNNKVVSLEIATKNQEHYEISEITYDNILPVKFQSEYYVVDYDSDECNLWETADYELQSFFREISDEERIEKIKEVSQIRNIIREEYFYSEGVLTIGKHWHGINSIIPNEGYEVKFNYINGILQKNYLINGSKAQYRMSKYVKNNMDKINKGIRITNGREYLK